MPVNSDLTEAQVREFFTTLSNWGKWGPNDQLGALNYITPAKRAQAAALVREGVSVSMSLPLATQPSPDNPTPVTHLMIQTGAPGETEMVPLPYSADYFAISPHGIANTHLDALCHVFNQGKMYNGYSASDVTPLGARNGAIDALKAASGWSRARRSPRRTWRPRNRPAAFGWKKATCCLSVRVGTHWRRRRDRGTRSKKAWPDSVRPACRGCTPAKSRPWARTGRVTSCPAATRRSCRSTRSRSSPWVSICSTTAPWTRSPRPVPRARAGRFCWPWLRSSSCAARHRR